MRVLFGITISLLLAGPAFGATRIVEASLDVSSAEILNLVGTARLAPGEGPIRVVATITAEDPAHAEAVGFVRSDEDGRARIVLRYPENVDRVRVDLEEFRRINTRVKYLDRKIRLDDRSGDLVRVDLEVFVPAGARLRLSQEAGTIRADRVSGVLSLRSHFGGVTVTDSQGSVYADTGSGTVEITGFRGEVEADSGSGTVTVENVLGDVRADTGSGQVSIRGVDGDVEADTGSGSVRLVDVRASSIRADTGSGPVRMTDVTGSVSVDTGSGGVRAEGVVAGPRIKVDTGSGGVEIRGDLGGVERVDIDTGSGSVELASSTPVSLELELDAGSGGINVDIPGLTNVRSGRGSFRAIAGTGRGYAKIDTGSGGIRVSAP
jgi:DUF4097 and DUF4098 domain-containing protein YvlB